MSDEKQLEEESPTLRSLRAQVAKLERKVSKLRANEELIKDAITQQFEESPAEFEVPKKPRKDRRQGPPEEIAVLHWSDTQIGKVTSSYNTQVAEERIMESARKTVEITELRRGNARVDEIRIYLGGDMIEGETIFAHQPHTIDSSVMDQAVINAPRMITNAILYLLEHFRKVKVIGVYGNHGRSAPRNSSANPRTNWDRVCYHTIQNILASHGFSKDRLEVVVPDDFYYVDYVYDYGNMIVHGHQIRGHAGFPWYGFAKKVWGWSDSLPEKFDNVFAGHFHTPTVMTLGLKKVYVNGSTESDNEFAKEELASCGLPAQRLLFMNQEHGVISDNLLYLSPVVPARMR